MPMLAITTWPKGCQIMFMPTRKHFHASIFTTLLTCMGVSNALATSQNADLNTLRQKYQAAQSLFDQGKVEQARSLTHQLEAYPLYPYLAYRELMYTLPGLNQQGIANFQKRYPDFPLQGNLYSSWMSYLAGKGLWKNYLAAYDKERADDNLKCFRAVALYSVGDTKQADEYTQQLWLTGTSQPDSCDKAFSAWKGRGKQTTAMIQLRFAHALEKDNDGLAAYLNKLLPAGEQPRAKQLLGYYQKPETVLPVIRSLQKRPSTDLAIIYAHALKRYGRSQPEVAISLAGEKATFLYIDEANKNDAFDYYLGRIASQTPERYELFRQRYQRPYDDDDAEKVLRYWLAQPNWQEVLKLVNALPAEIQKDEVWRYWHARADLQTGQNATIANQALAALAKDRSFYGYLAAQTLKQPYQLNHQPLPVSSQRQRDVMSMPAVMRAIELNILGQDWQSRREWFNALDHMTQDEKVAAARLAAQWQWHFVSIFTMAKAKYWDDTQIRFPMAYSNVFVPSAKALNLDPDWVMAISRQESAFRNDARSPVGARGLMQLMPATAQHTAKNFNLGTFAADDLYKPEVNIQLGTHYLLEVKNTFSGNRILATAAYNAGPSRVKRWLNERGHLPADVWVETIPFNETRKYVQNVLTYAVIYQKKLGIPEELIKPQERHLGPDTTVAKTPL